MKEEGTYKYTFKNNNGLEISVTSGNVKSAFDQALTLLMVNNVADSNISLIKID